MAGERNILSNASGQVLPRRAEQPARNASVSVTAAIIWINRCAYSAPTSSRLGFRVFAPGFQRAGQTSFPYSRTNWQA